ncbi:hypothetical protein [Natronorubrum aibiense]|nr:hypothetical protein [Natronorubrum aibiense]
MADDESDGEQTQYGGTEDKQLTTDIGDSGDNGSEDDAGDDDASE